MGVVQDREGRGRDVAVNGREIDVDGCRFAPERVGCHSRCACYLVRRFGSLESCMAGYSPVDRGNSHTVAHILCRARTKPTPSIIIQCCLIRACSSFLHRSSDVALDGFANWMRPRTRINDVIPRRGDRHERMISKSRTPHVIIPNQGSGPIPLVEGVVARSYTY